MSQGHGAAIDVGAGRIEAKFAAAFPQANLDISYLRPERVWAAVEDDQADLGIMSYAESSRDVVADCGEPSADVGSQIRSGDGEPPDSLHV